MDEPVDLPISGLAYGGAGIGRLDGLAVFVPGTVPGDLARVRLRARKPNYAEGTLLELIRPSPDRIPPRCAHFGACGGCQWMSLSYETQLGHKADQVRSALERIGKIEGFVVHPIVPSPELFGYRNRMEFSFGEGPDGLFVGLHRADDPSVIEPIRECHLQDPVANELLDLIVGAASAAAPSARPDARGFFLRRLALRKCEATGRFLAILVTRSGAWEEGAALAKRALAEHPQLAGIVRRIVTDDGRELTTEILAGEGTIRERIAGLVLELSAGSFLQVNSRQTEALYDRARSFAALSPRETLFDLYCGIGATTILIGAGARRATGIERSRESVRCARENARRNAASHVSFFAGDAERAAASEAAGGRAYDAVLVNPPRAGLPKGLVDSIARLAPTRVVYISCDPATLARDLARFSARGYRATDIAPFDLFPHTYHVETIARLEPR
jgi:23S rRNA (uracil1939-C5)-methyltransferase